VSTDREDRWGDDLDDDRSRRRVDPRAARSRVAAPGMMLIVFGVIGILIELASLGLAFSRPTAIADWYRGFIESQPPGKQRDDLMKQFKEQEAGMRLDTPTNIGGNVVGLLLNLLMVVGGAKMRSLSGYGLALTGSIAGLIPISGCICCAMPIGLWALIVLLNADVKAAFAANAAGQLDRDRYDDRDRFPDER
jgi:hypothetical protein